MTRLGDGAMVLVIDDDADIRFAAVRLLQSDGYTAVAAENGREALGLLRRGVRPQLILLDLGMPVMDGFAFRAAQLADPAIARIPVVVVSAEGPRVPKAAKELRAVATIEKPVDGDELLDLVNEFCAAA
jgi:CheY-like chemotaxis protein